MSNMDIHDMLQGACNVIRDLPEKYSVIGVSAPPWMGYTDGAVIHVSSDDKSLAEWAEQEEMRWWKETSRYDDEDIVWVIDFNGTAIIELVKKVEE